MFLEKRTMRHLDGSKEILSDGKNEHTMPLLRRMWTQQLSDTCAMFALVEVLKYKVPIALPCLAIKSLKPLEEDVLPLACSRDLLLLCFRPWWSTLAAGLAGWGGQVISPISVLHKA